MTECRTKWVKAVALKQASGAIIAKFVIMLFVDLAFLSVFSSTMPFSLLILMFSKCVRNIELVILNLVLIILKEMARSRPPTSPYSYSQHNGL